VLLLGAKGHTQATYWKLHGKPAHYGIVNMVTTSVSSSALIVISISEDEYAMYKKFQQFQGAQAWSATMNMV